MFPGLVPDEEARPEPPAGRKTRAPKPQTPPRFLSVHTYRDKDKEPDYEIAEPPKHHSQQLVDLLHRLHLLKSEHIAPLYRKNRRGEEEPISPEERAKLQAELDEKFKSHPKYREHAEIERAHLPMLRELVKRDTMDYLDKRFRDAGFTLAHTGPDGSRFYERRNGRAKYVVRVGETPLDPETDPVARAHYQGHNWARYGFDFPVGETAGPAVNASLYESLFNLIDHDMRMNDATDEMDRYEALAAANSAVWQLYPRRERPEWAEAPPNASKRDFENALRYREQNLIKSSPVNKAKFDRIQRLFKQDMERELEAAEREARGR